MNTENVLNALISTHAPHARRGHCGTMSKLASNIFLLTRLMRGAARQPGGTPVDTGISTHAPHARRGCYILHISPPDLLFLLTRLMRGAAKPWSIEDLLKLISTHAPHARRGVRQFKRHGYIFNFYSRASCEARPSRSWKIWSIYTISTHAPHARRGFAV